MWAPIFDGLRAGAGVARAEKRPDVLLYIYNDHVTSFFFDHYSRVRARRRRAQWAAADEGGGPRDAAGDRRRSEAVAAHIGRSLIADEFDLSFFQDKSARPRLLLAAVDAAGRMKAAGPTRASSRCRCGVLQFPMPDGAALPEARPGAASGDRNLSRGPARWRSSPPAGSRTRCTASAPASTTPPGTSEFLELFEKRAGAAGGR